MYQHKGTLCLSITRSNNRYVYALQGVGVEVRNLWLETARWGFVWQGRANSSGPPQGAGENARYRFLYNIKMSMLCQVGGGPFPLVASSNLCLPASSSISECHDDVALLNNGQQQDFRVPRCLTWLCRPRANDSLGV